MIWIIQSRGVGMFLKRGGREGFSMKFVNIFANL